MLTVFVYHAETGEDPSTAGQGPSPRCSSGDWPEHALRLAAGLRYILPKLSNSPLRTPPRNACHSPDVKRRTGPAGSLLSRTPISPSAMPATSTQLLLEKLRELLTQDEPASGLPELPPSVILLTFVPR